MIVAILGCGPAGLLAAEAVTQMGHEPFIMSKKVKSQIVGAQFLHEQIPWVTPQDPDLEISLIRSGTRDGYAQNVYGDPSAEASWDRFPESVIYGWDLQAAYDKLWGNHAASIRDVDLKHHMMVSILHNYGKVYSTVPAKFICREPNRHTFESRHVWLRHCSGDTLIRGVNDDNLIYYNGYPPDGSVGDTVGPPWYRYSTINKYQCWEYSHDPVIYVDQQSEDPFKTTEIDKPLKTDCDCWLNFSREVQGLNSLTRLGRFGAWDRHQLTHNAYFDVIEDLSNEM